MTRPGGPPFTIPSIPRLSQAAVFSLRPCALSPGTRRLFFRRAQRLTSFQPRPAPGLAGPGSAHAKRRSDSCVPNRSVPRRLAASPSRIGVPGWRPRSITSLRPAPTLTSEPKPRPFQPLTRRRSRQPGDTVLVTTASIPSRPR